MIRKIAIFLIFIGLLFAPIAWAADPGLFWATGLTGGIAGCLDKINSATGKVIGGNNYPLETGDAAIVITTDATWFFRYDASSTAAEDTTNYTAIKPDDLGVGDPGRWIKKYHTTSWKAPTEVQISGGVAALSGQGSYTIAVESGASDDLDKLTGLEEGHEVILSPADGAKTVTIKNGSGLKLLNGTDFELNNEYDRMIFICIGSDICVELWRMSGGD